MSGQAEPTVTGFPDTSGMPSWLTWTAPDDSWEVSYGDDGDNILVPLSGDKVITVSAGKYAGARWFMTSDPRGLAAALLAAADAGDAAQERQRAYNEGRWCGECEYGVVAYPPCCTQGPVES